MSKNQNGFSVLEGFVIIVILAAIGFVGYFVWERQTGGSDTAYTPAPNITCEGEWFDTHTHLDDMEFSHDIAERMRENKVGCSLIFTHVNLDDLDINMLELREEFAPNPGRFVLFADIVGEELRNVTRQKLDNLWSKYPNVFKGFGENAFYRPPHRGTSLQTEPWPTIFEFAAEKDIFVMLHLTPTESNDLKEMLVKYPNTKVLLHHRELIADLPSLMKTHKNLYYTLDTTNLTTISQASQGFDEVLFFPLSEANQDNSEQFLAKLKANKSKLLTQALENWKSLVEVAPDRIFWGTDVAMKWHTDEEVYAELIKFSSEFVEKLPSDFQKRYKYDNALKAFGQGVSLDKLTDDEIDRLDSATEDED